MLPFLVLTLKLFGFILEVSCENLSEPVTCKETLQKSIIDSLSGCSIRPTLIDMGSMFSNISDVIQVVPDHITVDKCGGFCYIPPHSCNPARETKRRVQVMLVLSKWPHGEHETLCTEVEVHHQCQCGCQVQPEQCLPDLQV